MGIANVTWEDEENNRHVELSIAFAIEQRELKIAEITPKSVAFLCEQRIKPVRSIGVHTSAGRQMLAHQFQNSQQFSAIKKQLSEQTCALTA